MEFVVGALRKTDCVLEVARRLAQPVHLVVSPSQQLVDFRSSALWNFYLLQSRRRFTVALSLYQRAPEKELSFIVYFPHAKGGVKFFNRSLGLAGPVELLATLVVAFGDNVVLVVLRYDRERRQRKHCEQKKYPRRFQSN